tara:strand:+ start:372 stop:512 length:141 start_codon:yes stop_codon:yes gene_type:complete
MPYPICSKCGEAIHYNRHDVHAGEKWHKCNYKFWRRIEEFGECVKG